MPGGEDVKASIWLVYYIRPLIDLEKPKMILIGSTVKYKIKQFVNLPVSTAIHWYMTDEFLFFSDKTCGHLLKTGAGDPSRKSKRGLPV